MTRSSSGGANPFWTEEFHLQFLTDLSRRTGCLNLLMVTIRISRVPHKKHLYMLRVYDSEEPDNNSLYGNVIINIAFPITQQGQRS